ncbi:hypothetical protein L798_08892 [Zootermopsis nevadensis]|uniref:Uncharacterized protein n=1 Tax=Zootermopsis nevadensis TaxID=136037 RepID=A0A067R0X5_ZOONE|nr:hypothetical protein L798_08892 [Zootermopsis nevadensis]
MGPLLGWAQQVEHRFESRHVSSNRISIMNKVTGYMDYKIKQATEIRFHLRTYWSNLQIHQSGDKAKQSLHVIMPTSLLLACTWIQKQAQDRWCLCHQGDCPDDGSSKDL